MKQTIQDVDRRTVLRGVGTVAVAGMLAGCGGGGGGDGDTPTPSPSGSDLPKKVSDYLSDANNFDGSAEDLTDKDSVTVAVGAGNNGLAFDPAAIRIRTGTTVTWEWTGKGGTHNVVNEGNEFSSGDPVAEGPYKFTLEDAGNYLYYCRPHKGAGMKGAIIVE